MKGQDEPYRVGPGKPPLHSRIKKGEVRNPGGKTKEQATLERRNAEAAMRIRERILKAAEDRLSAANSEEVLGEFVEAAMLKLLKDSEDRGLGAPMQPVDHTNSDGSLGAFLAAIASGTKHVGDTD